MNKKIKEERTQQEESKTQYSKQQIINSKQYSMHKDLLQAILKDNENYTIDNVDKKIENFMKRKV